MNARLPFGTTYFYEKTFLTLSYVKNKYTSKLEVEDDLRVKPSLKLNLELICCVLNIEPIVFIR